MSIKNSRNQKIIANDLQIAASFLSRTKGLLGRKSLDEQEALIVKPCKMVHMFFMRFPIDVV